MTTPIREFLKEAQRPTAQTSGSIRDFLGQEALSTSPINIRAQELTEEKDSRREAFKGDFGPRVRGFRGFVFDVLDILPTIDKALPPARELGENEAAFQERNLNSQAARRNISNVFNQASEAFSDDPLKMGVELAETVIKMFTEAPFEMITGRDISYIGTPAGPIPIIGDKLSDEEIEFKTQETISAVSSIAIPFAMGRTLGNLSVYRRALKEGIRPTRSPLTGRFQTGDDIATLVAKANATRNVGAFRSAARNAGNVMAVATVEGTIIMPGSAEERIALGVSLGVITGILNATFNLSKSSIQAARLKPTTRAREINRIANNELAHRYGLSIAKLGDEAVQEIAALGLAGISIAEAVAGKVRPGEAIVFTHIPNAADIASRIPNGAAFGDRIVVFGEGAFTKPSLQLRRFRETGYWEGQLVWHNGQKVGIRDIQPGKKTVTLVNPGTGKTFKGSSKVPIEDLKPTSSIESYTGPAATQEALNVRSLLPDDELALFDQANEFLGSIKQARARDVGDRLAGDGYVLEDYTIFDGITGERLVDVNTHVEILEFLDGVGTPTGRGITALENLTSQMPPLGDATRAAVSTNPIGKAGRPMTFKQINDGFAARSKFGLVKHAAEKLNRFEAFTSYPDYFSWLDGEFGLTTSADIVFPLQTSYNITKGQINLRTPMFNRLEAMSKNFGRQQRRVADKALRTASAEQLERNGLGFRRMSPEEITLGKRLAKTDFQTAETHVWDTYQLNRGLETDKQLSSALKLADDEFKLNAGDDLVEALDIIREIEANSEVHRKLIFSYADAIKFERLSQRDFLASNQGLSPKQMGEVRKFVAEAQPFFRQQRKAVGRAHESALTYDFPVLGFGGESPLTGASGLVRRRLDDLSGTLHKMEGLLNDPAQTIEASISNKITRKFSGEALRDAKIAKREALTKLRRERGRDTPEYQSAASQLDNFLGDMAGKAVNQHIRTGTEFLTKRGFEVRGGISDIPIITASHGLLNLRPWAAFRDGTAFNDIYSRAFGFKAAAEASRIGLTASPIQLARARRASGLPGGPAQIRATGTAASTPVRRVPETLGIKDIAFNRIVDGYDALTGLGYKISLQQLNYDHFFFGAWTERANFLSSRAVKFREGTITKEAMLESLALDNLSEAARNRVVTLLDNGSFQDAASFYGIESGKFALGAYGKSIAPRQWRTNVAAKAFSQFGTWSLTMARSTGRNISSGRGIARLGINMGLMGGAAAAAGLPVYAFWGLGSNPLSVAFMGGPVIDKLMWLTEQSATGQYDRIVSDADRQLLPLIPFAGFYARILEVLEEEQNILRILGVPKTLNPNQ